VEKVEENKRKKISSCVEILKTTIEWLLFKLAYGGMSRYEIQDMTQQSIIICDNNNSAIRLGFGVSFLDVWIQVVAVGGYFFAVRLQRYEKRFWRVKFRKFQNVSHVDVNAKGIRCDVFLQREMTEHSEINIM